MAEKKSYVKDYMTKNVISVSPSTPTERIIELMKESHHNSYPVEDNDELVGMVTAFDIVAKEWADTVEGIMTRKLVVANQDLTINDASRVMFRRGISRMPVVDDNGKLVGIITNTDMVRSHIERSTPNKVEYFKSTLEQLYGIKTTLRHMKVETKKLRPTQDRVYADELEGRTYELKMGLAEPAIVVKTGDRWILVDGHHRAVASSQQGYETVDCYVIDLCQDIKLGMEKTADKAGIKNFSDIEIIDDDKHPLIALTESMQDQESKRWLLMSDEIIREVYEVLQSRRDNPIDSYTSNIMKDSDKKAEDKILEKIAEEAGEVLIASKNDENLVYESVDLIFHTLLLLVYKGVELDEIFEEFERRRK